MNFEGLLRAQWDGYADRHRDRVNLILHIIAVPLFWFGTFDAVISLLFDGLFDAFCGLLLIALSMFLQGVGHDREAIPPEPWAGTWTFIQRVVAEQFINFPRFVIGGMWWQRINTAA